jgi:hypothetical protein
MSRQISLVVVEGALEVPASLKMLNALKIPTEGIVPINKRGRINFWRDVGRYNQAAQQGLVLGFTDLNHDPCPSGLIAKHLKQGKHRSFILRIAERELESWLMADATALAKYFRISVSLLPANPDAELDPKQTLINLARRSQWSKLKEDVVPEQGSKGMVGKGYSTRMTEFIEKFWRPLEAQDKSESLRRALEAIKKASQE